MHLKINVDSLNLSKHILNVDMNVTPLVKIPPKHVIWTFLVCFSLSVFVVIWNACVRLCCVYAHLYAYAL